MFISADDQFLLLQVLQSFKIMDYSMLTGIHNLDQAARERVSFFSSNGASTTAAVICFINHNKFMNFCLFMFLIDNNNLEGFFYDIFIPLLSTFILPSQILVERELLSCGVVASRLSATFRGINLFCVTEK